MAKILSIAPWNVEHYKGDPVGMNFLIDDYSAHCLLFMEVQRMTLHDLINTKA